MNTFSNKTYSYCQVRIPKLYKRVTARSYCLNRLRIVAPPSVCSEDPSSIVPSNLNVIVRQYWELSEFSDSYW